MPHKASAPGATNRRSVRRHLIPEGVAARIEFGYPAPSGHPCSMRVHDISNSGISFVLAHELPGIEPGTAIDKTTVRIDGHTVRGDLVVVHLTPDETPGSVCGALFYPADDDDILELKRLIAALDAR